MKIYTRTGDEGTTGLLGQGRVSKDSPRIEAYGTVDELNAVLGVARAGGLDPASDKLLERIQNELFALGAALADPDPNGRFHGSIQPEQVEHLEREIDALEGDLEPLTQFILPGGTVAAARIHLARTVCRRAERLVVHLRQMPEEHVALPVLVYLNRLSDWLFVLARTLNRREGVADIPWSGL